MTAELTIVGAGPRGIALLNAMARGLASAGPTVIHVVDPFGFAGRVWQPDQPLELMMNTLADETTAFPDASIDPFAVGPTLWAWASAADSSSLPPRLRSIADGLGRLDYAPRALFGHYLRWSAAHVIERMPKHVEVTVHRAVVVALDDEEDGRTRVALDDGSHLLSDVVILAPGHTSVQPTVQEAAFTAHADTQGATYAPPSHPLDSPVDQIRPGQPVLLRGMALNFFDIVALLTQGRGGIFEREDDRLRYLPSGQEPKLYTGSHRGIGPYARVDAPGLAAPIRFLSDETVADLLANGPNIDLRRDVWPLVVREASWSYLEAMHRLEPTELRMPAEDILRSIRLTTPDTEAWTQLMQRAVAPGRALNLYDLAEPLSRTTFSTLDESRAWMRTHLQEDAFLARQPFASARAAVAATLRGIRTPLRRLFVVDGLSGESYRRDVVGWFGSLMRIIANGPPVVRIEQLAALAEAGIIDFLGANLSVRTSEGSHGFTATSSTLPGVEIGIDAVLDVFVQRQDVRTSADPLLRGLLERGRIRPAKRRNPVTAPTVLSAIDVNWPGGTVVDDAGRTNDRLLVVGVPLEGVRWNTALAGRTGTGSEFFADVEEVATSALRALDAVPVGSSTS